MKQRVGAVPGAPLGDDVRLARRVREGPHGEPGSGQRTLADGHRLDDVAGRIDRRRAHQIAQEGDRLVRIDRRQHRAGIVVAELRPGPLRPTRGAPSLLIAVYARISVERPVYFRSDGDSGAQAADRVRRDEGATHGNTEGGDGSGEEFRGFGSDRPEESPGSARRRSGDHRRDKGPVEGKKGGVLEIERTFADVTPDEFDMLVIPGGGAPENLRIVDQAVAFTRRFVESGKPVGSICHGPQLLISAKVLDGRTVTSVNKIRDDVMNAGANYVDEPLVIDGNLITSRVPGDLPQFNEALGRRSGLDRRRARSSGLTLRGVRSEVSHAMSLHGGRRHCGVGKPDRVISRPFALCDALRRLREAKAWIFDMDGVIYRGAEVLPGVKELLDALTLRQRPVMLATNNSMSTPEAYEHKLAAMGLDIPATAVITSALATRAYLLQTLPGRRPTRPFWSYAQVR